MKLTSLPVTFAHLVFIFFILLNGILGKVKFCLKGQHEITDERNLKDIFTKDLDWRKCSGAIVLRRPFVLQAVESTSEPFCVKESICEKEWKCAMRKQTILAQVIRLGKPDETGINYIDDDTIVSELIPECFPNHFWLKGPPPLSRPRRDITGLVPSERTSGEEVRKEVDDQTKRLFYYLTGINQDQVNSHLRVVKLFQMSTELVTMICDPFHIRQKFLKEIEKSFLFILKEQGFDKLVDLDLESYTQLRAALEYCAVNATMVKFIGGGCQTGSGIDTIYTMDGDRMKSLKYERDEKTFKWGEYDIVLDAAWSIMNIVHGGCFESFTDHVNLHHKLQVAIEQLFHTALHLRWENPTVLADPPFYNSIFQAKINETMEAMDACTRYLYLLTPFKTQLNRPIHESFYRRKKRSVSGSTFGSDHAYSANIGEKGRKKEELRAKVTTPIATCLSSEKMDKEIAFISTKSCNKMIVK